MGITAEQVRAARAILRLDQAELAKRAGISVETIKRIERGVGAADGKATTLLRIRQACEAAGIEFTDANDDIGPGVRITGDRDRVLRERLSRILAKVMARELFQLWLHNPEFMKKRGAISIAEYMIKKTDWPAVLKRFEEDQVVRAALDLSGAASATDD